MITLKNEHTFRLIQYLENGNGNYFFLKIGLPVMGVVGGGHPQNEVRKIQDLLASHCRILGGSPVLKLLGKIETFRIIPVIVGYLGVAPVLKLLALTNNPTCTCTHDGEGNPQLNVFLKVDFDLFCGTCTCVHTGTRTWYSEDTHVPLKN